MPSRPRLLAQRARRALEQFPVVGLFGARQVGKSTLALELGADPPRRYLTLDELATLATVQSDPQGFVEGLETPVTLDEAQRGGVPLLLAVKRRVDRERRRGGFLLTGSSRIRATRGFQETLAGRMASLTLRPMTWAELRGRLDANPLDRLLGCRSVRDAV